LPTDASLAICVTSQTPSFSIHCTGAVVEPIGFADHVRWLRVQHRTFAAHAERQYQVKLPVITAKPWPTQTWQWPPVVPLDKPVSKATTPTKRSMIAWRLWHFHGRAIKSRQSYCYLNTCTQSCYCAPMICAFEPADSAVEVGALSSAHDRAAPLRLHRTVLAVEGGHPAVRSIVGSRNHVM
jgi:hypothetical protein